ncbi:response regulator transcription factor [Actinoplanes sp. NPDC049548]|uniref:response regulator transcription factor n=1 Tax=Actinoplanes sp. NPDC049548 TaxID=3155152 RepID=UPI003421D241
MPPETEASIRVLVVDDHALLRDGLRELLDAEDDIVVVGEAGDGDQAVAAALALRPDVIVLDIEMPGPAVTVTIDRLRQALPQLRILILSMHDDPAMVQRVLSLGVNGYLLKSVKREEFVGAVRTAHRDPERIILSISRQSLQQVNSVPSDVLSPREREIMALVAVAMSNSQIANRLYITENTVKRHLRNIFTKLGAASRIDAVNKAKLANQLPTRKS